jgi:hypothetical protein
LILDRDREIERSATVYIVAQHQIKDPARFWSVSPQGPGAPTLRAAYPSQDKTKGVCLWESDSIDALRDSLDPLVGDAAENTYFELDAGFAVGLPERAETSV